MSLQFTSGEPPRPTPVVYDPLPSPSEQFRDDHNGVHTGPVREWPRRPFHPTKCAHSGADIVRMAATGRTDAAEFIQALLDVVEDNTGSRPYASILDFYVNTGTPSQDQGWVYSVRIATPLNALVKMVRSSNGTWEYSIERYNQRVRTRSTDTNRPLHPRRHRESEDAQELYPPEQRPVLPHEIGERNVDI